MRVSAALPPAHLSNLSNLLVLHAATQLLNEQVFQPTAVTMPAGRAARGPEHVHDRRAGEARALWSRVEYA